MASVLELTSEECGSMDVCVCVHMCMCGTVFVCTCACVCVVMLARILVYVTEAVCVPQQQKSRRTPHIAGGC